MWKTTILEDNIIKIQPSSCNNCLLGYIDLYSDNDIVCDKCKYNQPENKIKLHILKFILQHTYQISTFIKYRGLFNIPNDLEILLVKFIKMKEFEKVKILLMLGGNINFNFDIINPNFSLITYLRFKNSLCDRTYIFLQENNYIMDTKDKYGQTIMGHDILSYFSNNFNNHSNISQLLKLGWDMKTESLNNLLISGMEYHNWRKDRLKRLLDLGIMFDLDAPIKNSNKLLRDTRLGKIYIFNKWK